MIALTDITGLAGCSLAIAVAVTRLPGVSRLSRWKRTSLLAIVLALVLVPFDGLPTAAYVRGAIGDLSVPSLLLLVVAALRFLSWEGAGKAPSTMQFCSGKGRYALLLWVLIAAMALYPKALGLGSFDPYRLGYGNAWFLAAMLIVTMAAISLGFQEIVLAVTLAVLAWGTGWYESGNLWDYLLDPLVTAYAAGALGLSLLTRISRPSNKTV